MDVIENILDEFDFQRVQTTMKALNWTYFDSADAYPSIAELRKMARNVLKSAQDYPDKDFCMTGCGGFEAERHMFVGNPKKYYTLRFVVTEWHNED